MVRPMTLCATADATSHTEESTNAMLHAAIANELRRVRSRVETLAEALVGDAYFVEHYLEHLQGFDMIVQSTDETAAILDRLAAGADVRAAIAPVRLGCVHERLHTALREG
jgi:glutamyl-tRNA reductase